MSSLHVKPRQSSANIFINYRREDTAGHAGRLFDALSSEFSGRLFMDVDTLEPGVDFVEAIDQAVGSCEVLLVVIGREWLTIVDKAGRRRLDDPGDFVGREVESALGRRIRVIPVLVEDAPMPRAEELPASLARLARHNAIELSDARWVYDVKRLADAIQAVLKKSSTSEAAPVAIPGKATPPPAQIATAPAEKPAVPRAWLLSLGALVLVAAVVLVSVTWIRRTPSREAVAVPTAVIDVPTAVIDAPAATIVAPAAGDGPPAAASAAVEEPRVLEPVSRVEAPATKRAADGPAKSPARVPPVPARVPKAVPIPLDEEPPAPTAAADPGDVIPAPAPTLQPARATILSPRNGETVGSDVTVRGTVSGLGDQQIFMGIRQKNGSIYPRGELFAEADGTWSIKLKSSKEKTFDILVVASSNQDATQVLRDQRSRDNGLSILPKGASVSSSIVTLKKQGKFLRVLKPKRPKDVSGVDALVETGDPGRP